MMPFGKFAHTPLHLVPTSYLTWVLENVQSLSYDLEEEIKTELIERLNLDSGYDDRELEPRQPPPPEALGVWEEGYAKLSRLIHPDRGGSKAAMQLLNDINEKMRRALSDGR